MLHGEYPLRFLALLLVGKLVATSVTVGAGAVGGVFTPTLFLGAALGGLLGEGLHSYGLALELSSTAFALVGMGCTLAATTHSLLLAVIMVFEISLNHTLFPPLLVACTVAALLASKLRPDDIYRGTLRRRGFRPAQEPNRIGATTEKTIGDLLHEPIRPLALHTPFREIVDRFLASSTNHFPVVDAAGTLKGWVALQDLKQHLGAAADLDTVIAYDVMRPPPPCLTPDQRVLDALPVLLTSELRNVPVVSTRKEMKLVGSVNRAETLGLMAEAIDLSTTR
jgi:CIC family chloride channel protein